jgi:hypothetical protein
MTPAEFKQARKYTLDLTAAQAAPLFGLGGVSRIYDIESADAVPGWHQRLMHAYLDGYRPVDWPIPTNAKTPPP